MGREAARCSGGFHTLYFNEQHVRAGWGKTTLSVLPCPGKAVGAQCIDHQVHITAPGPSVSHLTCPAAGQGCEHHSCTPTPRTSLLEAFNPARSACCEQSKNPQWRSLKQHFSDTGGPASAATTLQFTPGRTVTFRFCQNTLKISLLNKWVDATSACQTLLQRKQPRRDVYVPGTKGSPKQQPVNLGSAEPDADSHSFLFPMTWLMENKRQLWAVSGFGSTHRLLAAGHACPADPHEAACLSLHTPCGCCHVVWELWSPSLIH